MPWLIALLLTVFVNSAEASGYNETRVEMNTRWDLMHWKDNCAHEMRHHKEHANSTGHPEDWELSYSSECRYVDNFTMSKLSTEEIFRWIYWSNGESGAVRMLIDQTGGISVDALKTLILNITNIPHELSSDMLGAFATVGEAYFRRLGILHNLTVSDVTEFGPHFVYLLPSHYYSSMSDELFDHVLQLQDTENDKARIFWDAKDAADQAGTPFNLTRDFLNGVTYNHLVWVDQPRLRALCRRAFTQYKHFNNLSTSDLDKVRYHLQCAPPAECSHLPNDWVQDNIDVVTDLPFNCHYKRDTTEWFRRSSSLYSTGNLCGRYVAQKSLEGGSNPLNLSSQADIVRMKGLILCIPDSYARTAIELAGCDMAKDAALKGFLKPSFVKYTFGNCIQLPSNMSTLNCSYISDTFGPYYSEMKMSFYQSIPTNILCEGDCFSSFKGSDDMPTSVKKFITKTCFSGQSAVLDATAVDNLGAMVTDLSPDKFGQVVAADLERNIEDIKKDMESAGVDRNHQRHAVISQIGEKMVESGKVSAIADSKEIMKEVSIKKLKTAVSNLEQEFGLNDPNITLALTDSQNKWIMEEVKKNKKPSNFSASEIKGLSSAATGFLRSDIEEISEYQTNQSDPRHMQIAKALCEQPHWPFGSLNAINRLLIKKSLELVDDAKPFESLSEADVDQLDCECMMDFKGSELTAMKPTICGSVCTKIGYCDRLRCMRPEHRREILSACMTCMGIQGQRMSFADIDRLGPNLISQFTQQELEQYVPGEAVKLKLHELKHMCMDKNFRTAVSGALQTFLGTNGANIDETSLRLMGSAIMLFPESTQQQMDKAVMDNMAKEMMQSINPKDEKNIELQECCEKWLTDEDKALLLQLKKTLMKTIRDAIIYRIQNGRRKRSTGQLTCDDIRIMGEAFTTLTDADINAIQTSEFTECLSDIGLLEGWTLAQKELLLQKTINSLNTTVCNMTGTDIGQLGIISQAIDVNDLQCLPLNESDVITSLGSFSGWNNTQLDAIADGYMTAKSINNLTSLTVSEVAVLGEVMCGFEPNEMSTIPVAVVAGSGTQLGRLEDCDQDQYTSLKNLTLDATAFGPISNWTAADVTELQNVLIGLTTQEIPALTTDALEGLSADVISKLPPTVFAAMTDNQLGSLISGQVALVTNAQKNELTTAQIEILNNVTQGFFNGTGTNNNTSGGNNNNTSGGNNNAGGGNNTPSEAVPLTTAAIWITIVGILMFIAT